MRYLSLVFIVMIFALGATKIARADHNAGGDLTWECLANGKFKFRLSLYRYCEGINLGASAFVASTSPVTSISLARVLQRDVSPKCWDTTAQMNCYGSGTSSNFTIEENVYVSGDITINGTPPASGWDFYWTSCCRPAPAVYNWGNLVDNLHPQNQSYRIKATMFPYNNQNTYPCYDSSPQFTELPANIICTGYPFTYNHNATDADLDSLRYSWTNPLLSSGTSVTYATHTNTPQPPAAPRGSGGGFNVPSPGFSANVPLPWSHAWMDTKNVAAQVNPSTGEVSYTSFTPGQYATAVLVTSYRCGTKISEIMRDMPVTLLTCLPTPTIPPLSNTPPDVVFKWNVNDPLPIPLPAGDTVYAGDKVEFYIRSTDIQFRPPGFTGQSNFLVPAGSQFGNLYADTANGCPYPPCATMDTNSIYYVSADNRWEGQYGVASSFKWTTDCNHIAQNQDTSATNTCFVRSNTYNFIFKVFDDWCPAPGLNFLTFNVTVLAPPAIPAPKLKCSKVLSNGDVELRWDQPISKQGDTLNSFRKYIILCSDSGANGPFDSVHVVQDIDSLYYLHTGANAINVPKYYIIQGISSCNDQSVRMWSDTIGGMVLSSQVYNSGGAIALNWSDFNPNNKFGNKTNGKYYVWQVYNNDTTLVDSTVQSWDSLDLFLCFPSQVSHFVTVEDTTLIFGCTSYSNTVIDTVGDITAPGTVFIDSVSYDTNNNIHFSWQPTAVDAYMYYIYKNGVLIDSVLASVISYQYALNSTDTCNLGFSISAKDSCGNVNAPGVSQKSMCLIIDDVVRCDTNKHISLSWDFYNPSWTGGTSIQYIWKSINNGPWFILDSVAPGINQYKDTGIASSTNYRYRVRNMEAGGNRGAWTTMVDYTLNKIITGSVVNAPELRCISYLNDTTLKVDWNPPPNPDSNFNKYLIYYGNSPQSSTFNLVDSIRGIFTSDNLAWPINTFTYYVSDTVNAHYFYVVSASGCDGQQESTNSNIIKAIDLEITPISDSVNQLDWNKILSVQTGPQYNIIRNGNTSPLNTPFGTETAQDKWIVCSDSVSYYISFPDIGGTCTSISKTRYGYFEDDTPPAKLFIDSVSMLPDSSFTGMVGWSPNISKDIESYVVLKCLPGSYEVLDTVPANTFYYLDVANAPSLGINQYSVTAADSCGNNNLAQMNFDCQKTIELSARMDKCAAILHLNWNAYEDFTSGANVKYRIYASRDGGPFSVVGTTNEVKFSLDNLILDSYYCFYVQAWENDGSGPFSSSSALSCETYEGITSPEFSYLQYVSVEDSGIVRMCMKVDLNSDLGEYWIRRSAQENANFQIIATAVVPDPKTPNDSVFCFQDKPVQTDQRSYYYKIDVTDPCGNLMSTSNIGKTIFLTVKADREKQRNLIEWNTYKEWNGNVQEYLLYRQFGKGGIELVETLTDANMAVLDEVEVEGETIRYLDDVSNEANATNGQFCYFVVAKEGPNTFMNGEQAVSKSNIACAAQSPAIFVPNSFTPNGDGLNDRFMPQLRFHDVRAFKMQVYNRWGERIYASEDPKEGGWDGTYNGQLVPAGAYVYIVNYSSADGQEFEAQGTVTVTR